MILHADNANAMRAATLETRLEELGDLRSYPRQRVSFDKPYPESLQDCEVPSRLPDSAIREQGGGLTVGDVIIGLLQQPAPLQRHQILEAP